MAKDMFFIDDDGKKHRINTDTVVITPIRRPDGSFISHTYKHGDPAGKFWQELFNKQQATI